jgi:hypothetical protein
VFNEARHPVQRSHSCKSWENAAPDVGTSIIERMGEAIGVSVGTAITPAYTLTAAPSGGKSYTAANLGISKE